MKKRGARTSSAEAKPWMLLKANALALPLRPASLDFVLATPPHLGVKNLGANEFCTGDARQFRDLLEGVKRECLRVLKPGAHVALNARQGRTRIFKPFDVLQKRRRGGQWRLEKVRTLVFRAPYVDVEGFWWWALPVSVYADLLRRYTRPGDVVAHVFCGSGNGGLAIVRAARKAVMIDLHYHALSQRRMKRESRAPTGGC